MFNIEKHIFELIAGTTPQTLPNETNISSENY